MYSHHRIGKNNHPKGRLVLFFRIHGRFNSKNFHETERSTSLSIYLLSESTLFRAISYFVGEFKESIDESAPARMAGRISSEFSYVEDG